MSESWEKLEAQMRAMRPEPLSPELEERILSQLDKTPVSPRRSARRYLAWGLVAAACCVVVGVSSWLLHRNDNAGGIRGPESTTPLVVKEHPTEINPPGGGQQTPPGEKAIVKTDGSPQTPHDGGKTPVVTPRLVEGKQPAPRVERPEVPQPPKTGNLAGSKSSDSSLAEVKPATVRPATIQLEIAEGENPDQAWDKYFASHEPENVAVRDAARRLMNEQKFDHVIGLIEAALRHRQAQPWMYEALALAMQAAHRPKEQVERAVMSAADFCTNTSDLMYLGVYLTQLGLDQRAISIFHQVAQLEPVWAEPYMHAMKAAQRINDLDGLQWSTVGILSQGWSTNQSEVWQTALRVARATLADLYAQKRDREAVAFEAALDAALVRDCVVRVFWTGDAELDLLVEEPTGVVCSMRNYRTTAGGVLCGDVGETEKNADTPGHCQMYLCPKGFSGLYRLLVRRVWGEVVADKVTVEIITHFHTPEAVSVRKRIPLDKGEAMVQFALTDGRRKEKLQEQQLANAAIGQMAVGQQILAQQIAALSESPAVVPTNGAVGYQPVIVTLPSGANLAATAVVSADRRYVRITCVPLFSGITKVTTFNYSSGSSGTSSGGGTQQQFR